MIESDSTGGTREPAAEKSTFSFISFFITTGFMFVTWLVLSGKFEPLLIGLGLISSMIVAWFFHDLLFPQVRPASPGILVRFTLYIPWLILEIIKANFHLLFLVFHPRMKDLIDPHIVHFKTDLQSELPITTLANSITLTPGTITVTASADGDFKVHAIDRPSGDALPGDMLEKTAAIFGENK